MKELRFLPVNLPVFASSWSFFCIKGDGILISGEAVVLSPYEHAQWDI